MNTSLDLIRFVLKCTTSLGQDSPLQLTSAVLGGLVAAAVIWFAASRFSNLWNLRFNLKWGHHVLCGISALITLFAVVGWVALSQAKVVAEKMIFDWERQVNADSAWGTETFRKTYYTIQALNIENFSNYPTPESGGRKVPLNHAASKLEWATTYANEGLLHYSRTQPFLALMLWADASIPRDVVEADENEFFSRGGQLYPAERAIELVAQQTRQQLIAKLEHLIAYARTALALVVAAAQALSFGLIAFAAYRDLKVSRVNPLRIA